MLRLDDTIADLEKQSVRPSEIIITDAGSSDGSYERLLSWSRQSDIPVHILKEEGCSVARGRNLAIEAASYDLIVSTDFGCRFHEDWLKSLTAPFNGDRQDKLDNVRVCGGVYSVLEDKIQSKAAKANFILTNAYKLDTESWFIPSSRSIAYFKSVWEDAGKYPEWLTLAGDDLVFGMKLKAKGYKWEIVTEPFVYWLRHESARGYIKEAARYGLGDGEARVNLRNTKVVLVETVLRLLFPLSLAGLLFGYLYFLPILLLSLLGFRPYFYTLRNWLSLRSTKYNFQILLYSFYLLERSRWAHLKAYLDGYLSKRELVKEGRKELKELFSNLHGNE